MASKYSKIIQNIDKNILPIANFSKKNDTNGKSKANLKDIKDILEFYIDKATNQLKLVKKGLDDKINYHEKQISLHQELFQKHQKDAKKIQNLAEKLVKNLKKDLEKQFAMTISEIKIKIQDKDEKGDGKKLEKESKPKKIEENKK